MNSLPFERLIAGAAAIATTVILFIEVVYLARTLSNNPLRTAIFCQVLVCMLRNIPLIFEILTPMSPNICQAIVMIGFSIYFLWSILVEAVLLLRAQACSSSNLLTGSVIILWIVRIVTELYQTALIVAIPSPNNVCNYTTDWSVSLIVLATRLTVEFILLIPFLLKGYDSYQLKLKNNSSEATMWLKICQTNGLITILIAIIEIMAPILSNITIFLPWLSVVFTVSNFIESLLIVYVINDLKFKLQPKSPRSAQLIVTVYKVI
ncbi:hypothetical protein BC833DRAFT_636853 [Globomyces pollinis-pini]|nr:hypothetical protein BC833DRAFT_636853 [Globomyces pollinis-pini]